MACRRGGRLTIVALIALTLVMLSARPVRAQSAAAPAATPAFDNGLHIPDLRKVVPTASDAKGVSATL